VLPKIALLSLARNRGTIKSQYFTPRFLHPAHAVSGAVCIAAASKCKGTVAAGIAKVTSSSAERIEIEHPCGKIPVEIEVSGKAETFTIESAGTFRTARKLMEGYVYF